MTITRYTLANIVLLCVGALVCTFTTFMLLMTAGFGAEPVHDFRSFAFIALIVVGLLTTPAFLITFRWPKIGSISMWIITACWAVIGIASGALGRFPGLVFLFVVQAIICRGIQSGSEK